MKYEAYLRSGQLEEALNSLQEQIRAEPHVAKYRISLFQLLLILGEWQRALKQLDVLRQMDTSTLAMVYLYRPAIICEMIREQVFQAKRAPVFVGQPSDWQALLVQVLALVVNGRYAEASSLKDQAFELASASQGQIDAKPFEWLADADSRLGPNLEVIMDGGYRWVAFNQIQSMSIEKPTDLRDLVWLPARIRWVAGGDTAVLIPTRYPDSQKRAHDLALAHKTEWEALTDDFYIGYGQRMLASNVDDHALLDARLIEFSGST